MVLLCDLAGGDSVPIPVMKALHSADNYELLSLDPNHHLTPGADNFYGFTILGSVSVTDQATRAKLSWALRIGAWQPRMPAHCFNPRHGIRVARGGHNEELVICFECSPVEVREDGRLVTEFLVSNSPQTVFDNVLRKAGVPLPEKPYSLASDAAPASGPRVVNCSVTRRPSCPAATCHADPQRPDATTKPKPPLSQPNR